MENSQRNTPVTMLNDAVAEVFDFDQGTNGTFKLYLEDPTDTEPLLFDTGDSLRSTLLPAYCLLSLAFFSSEAILVSRIGTRD